MANILQIAVPTGPAAICWPARSDVSIQTLLFINQDLVNTVWLGQTSSVTANGANSIPIPPNGTFSGDASSSWYVIGSVAGTASLVMVPNGQAFFRGLSQGQGKLALPAFQSPNYVTGVSGWAVFQNGHAEFNDILVRGTIIGSQEFLYSGSGVAAPNTLIYSNSSTGSVQDSAGNWYLAGDVNYGPDVFDGTGYLAVQRLSGVINFYQAAVMTGVINPWVIKGSMAWDSSFGVVVQNVNSSVQVAPNSITIQTSSSGTVKANPQIEFVAQSAAPAATANGIAYADSLGSLHVIDGTDGNKYATERMSPVLFADTAALTALTTVFTFAGGIRTYTMHGRFYCTPVLNAQLSMEVVAPAGATGQMSVEIKRATTWFGGVAGSVNAVNSVLVNLPAASGYMIDFHCVLHLTAAGTVNIQVGSATANALVINAFSSLDIMPT